MERNYKIDNVSSERARLGTDFSFKRKILWKYVILNVVLHIGAVYGLCLVPSAHYLTYLWAFVLWFVSIQGVTMGAHRLFAHRSYKTTLAVRLVLIICHTISGQFSAYRWAKDHRSHHKYTDTDADPNNTTRGYFFAHYGWMFVQKHPLVYEKLKQVDDSDLKADKLLMFQDRHLVPLHLLISMVIPSIIPVYFWGESIRHSLYVGYVLRLIIVAHCIASINSVAHAFGNRPYEKNNSASDKNLVNYFTVGEGSHNYHHTFPWDYKCAELGSGLNTTAYLIDFLVYFGWASVLKRPSPEMIKARVLRTGDGSHPKYRKSIDSNNNDVTVGDVTENVTLRAKS